MQWKIGLPATEPTPTQSGSSVANFELYPTQWLGLELCDPNSNPFGPCTASSDSNVQGVSGSAFLELQFYPPGSSAAPISGPPSNASFGVCSTTQWCVSLHINTFQNNAPFVKNNCLEPTIAQLLTTNGSPSGPTLFMSNGDSLVVTIHDTTNGLQTDVNDLTSGVTGTMVASAANGFTHNTTQSANGVCSVTTTTVCTQNSNCPSGESCVCAKQAFTYHPMWNTAQPGQGLSWAGLPTPNVSFDAEIGHFELCPDSACATLPDNADDGVCSVTFQVCKVNSDCPTGETCNPQTAGSCGTVRSIGGCGNPDLDQDGLSYQADWPDGTAAHPASVVIGSPNDDGVGPLSASGSSSTSYIQGYNSIQFATTESTATTFYPFYSQAGTGAACRFNFGNDVPGVTTNDFSQAAQYGTTITNPCFPGPVARCKDFTTPANSSCQGTAAPSDVDNGSSDPDGDTLTLTLNPTGPYTHGPNPVTLTATDPGGATSSCNATVTVQDETPPTFSSSNPTTVQITGCQPTTQLVTLTAPSATDICSCFTLSGQVTAVNGSPASIALVQTGPSTFQGNLPIGTLTVQWIATNCDGFASAPFTQTVILVAAPALYATHELNVFDRATIVTTAGIGATIDNSGTASGDETEVFRAATTGSILSDPSVQLNGNTVQGNVQTAGTVRNNGATVTGQIIQHSAPNLPPFPTLTVPSPFPSGNDINVFGGRTVSLAPGAYDDVEVFSGGTLALQSGTYFFHELNVFPQGTLKLDTSGGTVTVDVKQSILYQGSVSSNGAPNQFVLGYVGTQIVNLQTAFSGIVIAPSAIVQLTGLSGAEYAGAFYGTQVIVNSGITVTESPFACQ